MVRRRSMVERRWPRMARAPLRGCVVGQPGLDRGQGVGPVVAAPAGEGGGPPLKQIGIGDFLQHVLAERLIGQELEAVEDGVLPLLLHLLVGLVEGLHGLLQDGLHPRPPLVPQPLRDAHHRVGGAVPVGEDAGVQQVDAGGARLVGQVDEAHLVGDLFGDVFEDAGHQVGVGIDDNDGVAVPACRLLLQLVRDKVVHEGGLAHAGAGDVEVVAAQQVVGESNLPPGSRGGVAHQGAAPDALRRGAERPRAGPLHQGRLVACSGRVPEAGDLTDSQDAAPAEQAGGGGVQHVRVGHGGQDLADLEPRPCGVVVVAVGGGHRAEKLSGPLRPRAGGHYRRDLELGVEGDAGDLLLYQDGVFDAAPGLLPPPPRPAARGQSQGRAGTKERRLPYLAVLDPQVALQGGESADAQHGHRHAVHLQRLGLEGVGGLPRLHAGPLVGLVHVGLGPVGAEGAQQQTGHHSLPLVEGGQCAHEGDERVRAGVEQVVVPEGPQGDVLGAVRPQGHRPRLLLLVHAQGVVAGVDRLDAGLGVVGRELASHHPVVEAAGHQRHPVHVPGQLQGEGFGHGDGLEQVLHAQQGALPGPGRRHRQQDGAFLPVVVSEKQVPRVQLHRGMPSFLC